MPSGPSVIDLFVQYSQSDLPPLRPLLCGEAPGRESNPGRADLVAGTLTTRPPNLKDISNFKNSASILYSNSVAKSNFHFLLGALI